MYMRTTLKQLPDLALNFLVFKTNPILEVQNREEPITSLGRFKETVSRLVKLSSPTVKNLTEKSSIKPTILPIKEDIMKLKMYVFNEAKMAFNKLKKRIYILNYMKYLL